MQETRIEPNTVGESRQMAADARARVLVIFLDTYHTQLGSSARMRPLPPSVDAANLGTRQNSLRELAANTDGTAVIGTNDIEDGLRRIAADLSSYYLLGYYSSNAKLGGRFRTLTVKVNRPGVQVRARRGYRGLTADDVLSAASSAEPALAVAASSLNVAVNPRAQFRIRTSGWTPGEGAAAGAWIAGELDYAMRKELAWSAGAMADVTVVSASGVEVTSASIEIPATESAFSIRVPAEGGIAPGEYAVRVSRASSASGSRWRRSQPAPRPGECSTAWAGQCRFRCRSPSGGMRPEPSGGSSPKPRSHRWPPATTRSKLLLPTASRAPGSSSFRNGPAEAGHCLTSVRLRGEQGRQAERLIRAD